MNVTAVAAGKVSEFNVKISHIVTNGCSFTYCQNLPDITNNGWPAIIANNLNCPVVNLGLPGVGNDSIYRRTYEYIYENQPIDEYKPLVIIAWTQRWRREGWLKKEEDYAIVSFPNDKPEDHYQYALLENWSDEDFIRKTTLYRLSLISLFENLHIPYLMFNYSGAESSYDSEQIVNNKFPNMVKESRGRYDLGDLYHLTGPIPKLPCGHDDIEGQNVLSGYLLEKINEIYPNLEYTKTSEFLTLRQFSKTSNHHRRFPEWCNFTLKSDRIV